MKLIYYDVVNKMTEQYNLINRSSAHAFINGLLYAAEFYNMLTSAELQTLNEKNDQMYSERRYDDCDD